MPGETRRNRAQKAPKKVSNSFAAFTPIPLLPHLHFVLAMANLRIPGPLLLLLMIKKFLLFMFKLQLYFRTLWFPLSVQGVTNRGTVISRNVNQIRFGFKSCFSHLKNPTRTHFTEPPSMSLLLKWEWVCLPSHLTIIRIKSKVLHTVNPERMVAFY